MRSVLLLSMLLTLWLQVQNVTLREVIPKSLASAEFEKLRSIPDIRSSIYSSFLNAWNYIKNIAQRSTEKIKCWLKKVETHANDTAKDFEAHITKLKERSKALVNEMFQAEQLVQKCVEADKKALEDILKEIIEDFISCITANILKLPMVDDRQYKLEINYTKYTDELNRKLNRCVENTNNAEECFHSVRNDVYDDMQRQENNILRSSMQSRSMADDLLDDITLCSVDGLINASKPIAHETVEIIACVVKGKNISSLS